MHYYPVHQAKVGSYSADPSEVKYSDVSTQIKNRISAIN